jgi:fatty-acyl-CoA synthase
MTTRTHRPDPAGAPDRRTSEPEAAVPPFGPLLHEGLDVIARLRPEAELTFASQGQSVTLADLAVRSRRAATRLTDLGLGAGDRIGVLCSNEPAFLVTVFAAARLGVAVCPLPLPTGLRDLDGYLARLRGIVRAARLRHVVVTEEMSAAGPLLVEHLPEVAQVPAGELDEAAAGPLPTDVTPEHELIIQFTSGSTAAPKGVQLSHRNVTACLKAIAAGIDIGRPGERAAIWLPLFHDMGLFATLTAVLSGTPGTIWSPTFFVKDPAGWLSQISAGRYTLCPLPNFAYDYLLREVPPERAADYDLSAWRVAFNGAEPIAPDSLQAFLDRFAPAGFRPGTMMPVYGLAEATLAVTFPPLGRPPRTDWVDRELLRRTGRAEPREAGSEGARGVVGLGYPVLGAEVRVAGPEGRPVGDRQVGEVQVRGASVTAGYLDLDGGLPQPFTADGWLRTGDLGYLADGELHLTGREKEVIIVRGDNYYPEDVEAAVRSDPGVHKRRCVAFADLQEDGERVVLVVETALTDPAERTELVARLRARVRATCGPVDTRVVLVEPKSIPRTSSGKLQRLASRALAVPPTGTATP